MTTTSKLPIGSVADAPVGVSGRAVPYVALDVLAGGGWRKMTDSTVTRGSRVSALRRYRNSHRASPSTSKTLARSSATCTLRLWRLLSGRLSPGNDATATDRGTAPTWSRGTRKLTVGRIDALSA